MNTLMDVLGACRAAVCQTSMCRKSELVADCIEHRIKPWFRGEDASEKEPWIVPRCFNLSEWEKLKDLFIYPKIISLSKTQSCHHRWSIPSAAVLLGRISWYLGAAEGHFEIQTSDMAETTVGNKTVVNKEKRKRETSQCWNYMCPWNTHQGSWNEDKAENHLAQFRVDAGELRDNILKEL